jgi:hypothetical protein
MYTISRMPPTLFGDYCYYVHRKDYINFDTWKYPARALNIPNLFEYVQYLKSEYGDAVKIETNRSPTTRRYLGLLIRFNTPEAAQDLANRCNERSTVQ